MVIHSLLNISFSKYLTRSKFDLLDINMNVGAIHFVEVEISHWSQVGVSANCNGILVWTKLVDWLADRPTEHYHPYF